VSVVTLRCEHGIGAWRLRRWERSQCGAMPPKRQQPGGPRTPGKVPKIEYEAPAVTPRRAGAVAVLRRRRCCCHCRFTVKTGPAPPGPLSCCSQHDRGMTCRGPVPVRPVCAARQRPGPPPAGEGLLFMALDVVEEVQVGQVEVGSLEVVGGRSSCGLDVHSRMRYVDCMRHCTPKAPCLPAPCPF
jgi:hypothetical protein